MRSPTLVGTRSSPSIRTLILLAPILLVAAPGADRAAASPPEGESELLEPTLDWLVRHQAADGRWDADGFPETCGTSPCLGDSNAPDEGGPGSVGPGIGYEHFDAGVTALALLAFLRAGHTPLEGRASYRGAVRSGLAWLIGPPGLAGGIQADDGSIGYEEDDPSTPVNEGESIYDHGYATLALCVAARLTGEVHYRERAEEAVDWILQAQNPGYGWRYGVSPGDNDTSVTVTMVRALLEARAAGIEVPDAALENARSWLDRCTVGLDARSGEFADSVDRAGEVGYMQAGDGGSFLPPQEGRYAPLPSMTAMAVVGRRAIGVERDDPVVAAGAEILREELPTLEPDDEERSRVNLVYWWYGTQAASLVGGRSWESWAPRVSRILAETRRTAGCAHGSWDPVGDWGIAGGRVYSTAVGALLLDLCADGPAPGPEEGR